MTRRVLEVERQVTALQHARPFLNEQARYEGGVIIRPLTKGLRFDGASWRARTPRTTIQHAY
ncbi:hypothetical protein [Deinococcus hopiensis]|uniref:hypothetical protein n=1 Tax=Deinococcus hopiensis TaxID=309885 RepID=UPI00111C526A|nr:hypothetical protein [Deinococcus hopiensis]